MRRVLPSARGKDEYQSTDTQKNRVVEVLDDVYRVHGCKTACYQYLGTVGEKSLCCAREGVEYGCCSLWLYTETVGYVLGNTSHGYYRYGVIGCAYVDQ